MPDIMHMLGIAAPPARVYQALTTVEGFKLFVLVALISEVADLRRTHGRTTLIDEGADVVLRLCRTVDLVEPRRDFASLDERIGGRRGRLGPRLRLQRGCQQEREQ